MSRWYSFTMYQFARLRIIISYRPLNYLFLWQADVSKTTYVKIYFYIEYKLFRLYTAVWSSMFYDIDDHYVTRLLLMYNTKLDIMGIIKSVYLQC